MVAALAALFLIGWSAFAAAQFATARTVDPAEVARMEQQVQSMQADVQAIKAMADKRYQMTEQALRDLGLDPQRFQGTGRPFEAVAPLAPASEIGRASCGERVGQYV